VSGASSDRVPRAVYEAFTEEASARDLCCRCSGLPCSATPTRSLPPLPQFSPTDDDEVTCSVDWILTDLFHGADSCHLQLQGWEAHRQVNWTQRVTFDKWQLREPKPLKGAAIQPPPMTTCAYPPPPPTICSRDANAPPPPPPQI